MIDAADKRLAGLRLSVRERLARAINLALETGALNRADICRIGEVSVPQASIDIREIMNRFPKLLTYDASAKTYLATDRIAPPQIAGNPESWATRRWIGSMNDDMRPVRLRLSRARGFNLQEHSRAVNGLPAVNCARPGPYGNPYIVGIHGSRIQCVRFFICLADGMLPIVGDDETISRAQAMIPHMRRLAASLKGYNLACWCAKPKPDGLDICHCQPWLALANDADPVKTLRPYCEAITLIDSRESEPVMSKLARPAAL